MQPRPGSFPWRRPAGYLLCAGPTTPVAGAVPAGGTPKLPAVPPSGAVNTGGRRSSNPPLPAGVGASIPVVLDALILVVLCADLGADARTQRADGGRFASPLSRRLPAEGRADSGSSPCVLSAGNSSLVAVANTGSSPCALCAGDSALVAVTGSGSVPGAPAAVGCPCRSTAIGYVAPATSMPPAFPRDDPFPWTVLPLSHPLLPYPCPTLAPARAAGSSAPPCPWQPSCYLGGVDASAAAPGQSHEGK